MGVEKPGFFHYLGEDRPPIAIATTANAAKNRADTIFQLLLLLVAGICCKSPVIAGRRSGIGESFYNRLAEE